MKTKDIFEIAMPHAMSAGEVCDALGVRAHDGLDADDARTRQEEFGRNELPEKPPRTFVGVLLAQFASPLMAVIVAAAAVSFVIGHVLDGVFIAVVVLMNALLGAFQEMKAERALETLKKSLAFRATVLRDGAQHTIDSRDVVPGDIVLLAPGDRVPADGRVVQARDVLVSEAALSGESQPIAKNADLVARDIGTTDRTNMVYAGTTIEDGTARYVVTAIGAQTEMGRIAALIAEQSERQSPLQTALLRLARWMTVFILVVISAFIAFGLYQGLAFGEIMIVAIALVVSTIPEGLLPAVTVVLVLGMRQLAEEKALVRRLSAVEAMGAVSVICMDKTGTLTTGEMRVGRVVAADEVLTEIAGTHNVCAPGGEGECAHVHARAITIGFLSNDAVVEDEHEATGDWHVQGRPTDRALAIAGLEHGLRHDELLAQRTLSDQLMFSSARKHAVRVYDLADGSHEMFVLGAAEQVIARCIQVMREEAAVAELSTHDAGALIAHIDDLTARGYRLLACAERQVQGEIARDADGEVDAQELTFVGFIALKDPARTDVEDAVVTAQRAGVRPIVITGDHRNTAAAILSDVGLDVEKQHIYDGSDIEKLDDRALDTVVRDAQLFARVSPEHKIRIVRALMRQGEVVAMVGDGVNDAPALKAADIGIAVGSGTDLAKTVADVVLLDDSFATIVAAIRQGRLVFLNVQRILFFLLTDAFTGVALFFAALFAGTPLPLLPAQILWINLVEDGLPGMALTASREGQSLMKHRPRKLTDSLFTKASIAFMLFVFVISSVAAILVYFGGLAMGLPIEAVRTMVFVFTSIDSLVFAYMMHTFDTSLLSRRVWSNRYLNYAVLGSLAILLAGVYVPLLQGLLSTVALSWSLWGIVLAATVCEVVILEIAKRKLVRA